MAYTLGNKCAKNLCKRIVVLQLIIENVVTCFFGTQCRLDYWLDVVYQVCWKLAGTLSESEADDYDCHNVV